MLVMFIVAPLMTAPDGSLTAPTMLPVPAVVCAKKGYVNPDIRNSVGPIKAMIRSFFPEGALMSDPGYSGRPARSSSSLNLGSE